MDAFQRIFDQYQYRDIMKPGGFVIDGKPALTGIDPELVGDYVIMTVRDPLLSYSGDPAEILSERLDKRVLAGKSGMFTTYSGYYKGAHISIVSGGSGAPEAELVLIEFIHHTKASTFFRLGGCAAINANVQSGDLIIASGVVRDEGLSKTYIHAGYPATCSYELVLALAMAAEKMQVQYHIGIGRSGDSEHVGCGRPGPGGYFQPHHSEIIDYYNRAGVLFWDRESSAITTLCNLFGRRGGAIVSADNNLITRESFTPGHGQEAAIDVAFEGLSFLHLMDVEKEALNKRYWLPFNHI